MVDLEASRSWAVRTCRIHDDCHDYGIPLALHRQVYHSASYNGAFPMAGDKVQVAVHDLMVDSHVRGVVVAVEAG